MLVRAIAHGGCTDTVRESALKVDPGRKIPCGTGDSNPCRFCAWLFSRTLYQLISYPRPFGYLLSKLCFLHCLSPLHTLNIWIGPDCRMVDWRCVLSACTGWLMANVSQILDYALLGQKIEWHSYESSLSLSLSHSLFFFLCVSLSLSVCLSVCLSLSVFCVCYA